MNTAQLTNLAVTVIVGATATTVAKVGIDAASWQKDVADLVSLAVAVGTWYAAHRFHASEPVAPAGTLSNNNTEK